MSTKVKYYNRTIIPDFLKPLPVIDKAYAMKYQITHNKPLALAVIACQALMKIDCDLIRNTNWNDFVEIFQNNSRIVSDSYKRLCRINDPIESTSFILCKAKEKAMKLDTYLKQLKVMDDGYPQRNHWEMSNRPRRFPYIIIANARNGS